jgi:4-oxalocrotonate tautomerase
MPTLQLRVSPALAMPLRQDVAAALTELTAAILGKRAAVTAVLVQGFDADHWFIGGDAVPQATALLEIDITAGTNTDDEKAAFVRAAHAELTRRLGPLAEASYVIVREVAAGDWGYAGQTQRARQTARMAAIA